MNQQLRAKLAKAGLIEKLDSGLEAVPVSLFFAPRIVEKSRPLRRAKLASKFEEIAQRFGSRSVKVDLDSLSLSGQTIEALISVDQFDEVVAQLESDQVRTDILVPRKATL